MATCGLSRTLHLKEKILSKSIVKKGNPETIPLVSHVGFTTATRDLTE